MNLTARRLLIAASALVVLVAAGIVAWLLFSGNAPEEASLGDAVDVVAAEQDADPVGTTVATSVAPPEDEGDATARVDGTWTVDTTIGEFSFADATSSFAGFRVAEELRGIGAVDAVGRTPDVSGSIDLEGATLMAGSFTADLASLTTDRSRRDGAVRRALGVAEFPTATFEVAGPVDFGAVPVGDTSISVTAPGDLTIKGITNRVEFALEAQLVGDVIVVVGQIPVVFADFDVAVPNAASVLSADDNGVIEVQLFFTR